MFLSYFFFSFWRNVMKYVICLIFAMLIAISLVGCSWSAAGGVRAETYYPNDWKKGGDPADSRTAGADITAGSTPGRFPIPKGGK